MIFELMYNYSNVLSKAMERIRIIWEPQIAVIWYVLDTQLQQQFMVTGIF